MTALNPLDLTVYVGQEQQLLGINVQITQEGLKGWYGGGVPFKRTDEERLGDHGVFSEPGKRGARLVSVAGTYWADDPAEAAGVVDDLNGILAEGQEGRLTVVDPVFGTRWVDCYVTGTPDVSWDGDPTGTFNFDLICTDPRKYGAAKSYSTGIAKPGGGRFTDPYFGNPEAPGIIFWGTGGQPGTVTFTNEGTADVPPFFRVDGWFPEFTITEIETGRRLKYVGEIQVANWLELDSSTGTVSENGQADRPGLVIAEWPVIPGRSTRTYLIEAPGVEDSVTFQMTMTAAPAWW